MSDSDNTYSPLRSSFVLFLATAALSVIPSNVLRYISLGAVLISLAIHAAYLNRPSARLDRLSDMISIATDTLTRARSGCLQTRFDLEKIRVDLFKVELSASNIRSYFLQSCDASWSLRFQRARTIWSELAQCEQQIRHIQTSILLAIESEHQSDLIKLIKENSDILNVVLGYGMRAHLRANTRELTQEA
ncbi:hypothetical protein B0H11DRAFT_2254901 [Mycena galericulata]|nr:hypothetical protein B0H11DRAFT_2254901 [Mycena galericulata]